MKKLFILALLVLVILPLITLANTRDCQVGQDYFRTVDGNIDHYQSTGCTPHMKPYDCTVEIDLPGPPIPGTEYLNGHKININTATENQLDTDLFEALPTSTTGGIGYIGATISRIVYSKTGRTLTAQDRTKAGLCP